METNSFRLRTKDFILWGFVELDQLDVILLSYVTASVIRNMESYFSCEWSVIRTGFFWLIIGVLVLIFVWIILIIIMIILSKQPVCGDSALPLKKNTALMILSFILSVQPSFPAPRVILFEMFQSSPKLLLFLNLCEYEGLKDSEL